MALEVIPSLYPGEMKLNLMTSSNFNTFEGFFGNLAMEEQENTMLLEN